jgi:hypothetical protein
LRCEADVVTLKITDCIRRELAKPVPLAATDRQIDSIIDAIETKVARMKIPKEIKQQVRARRTRINLDKAQRTRSNLNENGTT